MNITHLVQNNYRPEDFDQVQQLIANQQGYTERISGVVVPPRLKIIESKSGIIHEVARKPLVDTSLSNTQKKVLKIKGRFDAEKRRASMKPK